MFHLRTEGDARTRGIAHGRAASERIAGLIDRYREDFADGEGGWRPGLGPDARKRKVDLWTERIGRLFPDTVAEIDGIAAGAGLPFEDVFELNLVFDLDASVTPACTVFGFADRNGQVWLGKSDDLGKRELGANAIHQAAPSGELRSVQIHFVGTVWTSAAVNEAGFGFGMTGLTGCERRQGGAPVLFLLPLLAEQCRTVEDAVALCDRFEVPMHGMSVLMGDATGDVAILEKHVAGQTVRRPAGPDAAVWETNHCLGKELAGKDDPASPYLDNSHARVSLLRRMEKEVERSLEGLTRMYRTHDDPVGICQHGQAGLHTDSGIIICPGKRTMWATEGYPCSHPFLRHEVDAKQVL